MTELVNSEEDGNKWNEETKRKETQLTLVNHFYSYLRMLSLSSCMLSLQISISQGRFENLVNILNVFLEDFSEHIK